MDLATAGLKLQPFRTHGRPLSIHDYASHREALKALDKTLADRRGLALLQGPGLSGKSTIVRRFVESRENERSAAIIDGQGLNTTVLLESALRQFGYELEYDSANELLSMLRVFAQQQAASQRPPLLVIENFHALNRSALRVLCELAGLRVRRTFALMLVLVSDRALQSMLAPEEMAGIARRVAVDFHLRPMQVEEARDYLHKKLRAAGSLAPGLVFPGAVCKELWCASGGWPGILDRVALLALARADKLPVAASVVERPSLPPGTWDMPENQQADGPPEPPKLILTYKGETLKTLSFDKPRLLLGRSAHNDICIDSRFISRHHALLARSGAATFLMDLNSTNGTLVNSRRVSNYVLVHDDVISLGHYRLKFSDPHATRRVSLEGPEFADTSIMKTLDDMRRLLARENTQELPMSSENLPTIGEAGQP